MRKLVLSGPAQQDLIDIIEHYYAIDPDLSAQLLQRIRNAPLILLDHPEMGAPTDWRGMRKWQVKGTPFLLFYAAGRDRVEIRRVRHAAQDWQSA